MKCPVKRVMLLVMDGVGCGAAPDAEKYGDAGSNTLKNCSEAIAGLELPTFESLGLGNITEIRGVRPIEAPLASWGKLTEKSVMKDTPTGHGEMMGIISANVWALFPKGFPDLLIRKFCDAACVSGVLGNKSASGTEIIKEFGEAHRQTGWPIVYTSGDSVFQIAAHEDVIPLPDLYAMCKAARYVCNPWNIGRVIARPFVGVHPNYVRPHEHRHDWAMPPQKGNLMDKLTDANVPIMSVGKIGDIFAHCSTGREILTGGNDVGMRTLTKLLDEVTEGFVFANLVDTDESYGHRRDPKGFARSLQELDKWLGETIPKLRVGDMMILTADHGNDPTFRGSDHTREYVPLLVIHPGVTPVNLGTRSTFADIGETIAEVFNVPPLGTGASFLRSIRRQH